MATFSKRANGKWFAQVRHKPQLGRPAINKSASFDRKADAQAWAAKIESEWQLMRAGLAPKILFREMLQRYLDEVTPTKRGYKSESYRIQRIMNMPLANTMLPELSDIQLREWAEQRMREVSTDSVIREWSTISHVLTIAVQE